MMSDKITAIIDELSNGNYNTALRMSYQQSSVNEQQQRWKQFLERVVAHPLWQASLAAHAAVSPRLFRAPGRSEIGGNHTDHNHGLAVVGTVTADIIAIAQQRNDSIVRIHNLDNEQTEEIDYATSSAPIAAERGSSAALIRGVLVALQRHGVALHGFDAFTTSAVPYGSGLSSSAAFGALATMIPYHFADQRPSLSIVDLAKVGQYAENEFFGKPCGLEDQIGSLNGGITQIDFERFDAIDLKQIEIDFATHGLQLAIVDSKESHAELTEHYAAIPTEMQAVAAYYGERVLRAIGRDRFMRDIPKIRAACGDRAVLRALHFFRECDRVREQCDALRTGDMKTFIRLVRASGASSWMWLQNCIVPRVNGAQKQAMALTLALTEEFISTAGIAEDAACRVHGGGFAGAIQVYLPLEQTGSYKTYMSEQIGADSYLPLRISPHGAGELLRDTKK